MQEVNVQVALRVRPMLPKETLAGDSVCVRLNAAENQIVLGRNHVYTFDHVFSQKTTQVELYKRCIDPLVKNFLEGYNTTVFAYGQTGSGKTHTMDGGSLLNAETESLGMMPQAVQQIYNSIQSDTSREYTVKISYFEIYKEELRDLMEYDTEKTLCIREDDKGNVSIVGAMEIVCYSAEDVMLHLRRGTSYRHTSSTKMNDHSSRSHAVFTLCLGQTWVDDDAASTLESQRQVEEEEEGGKGQAKHCMCAKFHFVDLAGSERVHKTGNAGERFKESVYINTGLLALGNVISALGDKKRKVSHIPYRDSKITRILKDSLGGNARTLMICCLSPSSFNLDESLNSLRFANRARNIRNKPVINRDPHSVKLEEMQVEIKALRAELQKQRTEIEREDSQDDIIEQYKQIQQRLDRVQTDCSHYQTVLLETVEMLIELRDFGVLTSVQANRLSDWLDLLEEMKNSVPATFDLSVWENETIRRLERDLKQCRRDLRCDEQIFGEKTRELAAHQDRAAELSVENESLMRRLEEMEQSRANIESMLLAKQIELDKLNARLQCLDTTRETLELDLYSDVRMEHMTSVSGARGGRPRAISVPSHALGNRATTGRQISGDQLSVKTRNIHTSPAAITVDRVLHSFRARSRLLASQLEDEDDVKVKSFSDEDEEEEGMDDNGEGDAGKNLSGDNLSPDAEFGNGNFRRSDIFRGTYRVSKRAINRPRISPNVCSSTPDLSARSMESQSRGAIQESRMYVRPTMARVSRQRGAAQVLKIGPDTTVAVNDAQLKKAEQNVRLSTAQLNELTLKIKMKEQLVRDLVRQNNEVERLNEANQYKIRSLEEEKTAAQEQLIALQTATKDLRQQERARNEQLQAEYRQRADIAVANIQQLRKKQKSTRNAEIDKRIEVLKAEVDSMKKQELEFLKENSRLEKELHEERERVQELETNSERRTNQLQAKINEMMNKHNGNISEAASNRGIEQQRVEEKARWLDEEMEALLAQRQAAERLEQELEARAEMLRRKEQMLAEKSGLVMKKLRSSQVVEKDLVHLSTKLEAVDERIEEKSRELIVTPREGQSRLRDEMERLQQGRDRINEEYKLLNSRLQDGGLLSMLDERSLIEMEEAIEALDAAIEYKNDSIAAQESELRRSRAAPVLTSPRGATDSAASADDKNSSIYNRLQGLSAAEARSLLKRYFDKAVSLRNDKRQSDRLCAELQMRVEEQAISIRELETSLSVATKDFERRLAKQKSGFYHEIDLLTKQLEQADLSHQPTNSKSTKDKDIKISELEKELYYYKKTSRDLKHKLKDLTSVITKSSSNHDMKDALENGLENRHPSRDGGQSNQTNPCEGDNPPTPRPSASEVTSQQPQPRNIVKSQKNNDSQTIKSAAGTNNQGSNISDRYSTGGARNQHSSPVRRQITTGANARSAQENLGSDAGSVNANTDSTARLVQFRADSGARVAQANALHEERSENINSHYPTADSISSRIRADESLNIHSRLVTEPAPPSVRRGQQTRREPRLRAEPVPVKQSLDDCVHIKDSQIKYDLHDTLVDSLEDGR